MTNMQEQTPQRNWALIVSGVLLVFFGCLCLFYPGLTLISIAFVAGAGFLFAGIASIITYVRQRDALELSAWNVVYGIIDIIVGLMFILHPLATAVVMPWVIGSFVIVYAVVELFSVVAARASLQGMWIWGIFSALLSLLIGVMFFIWPETLSIFIALFALLRGFVLIGAGWKGIAPF